MPALPQDTDKYDFLLPIVTGWLGKISIAKRAKKPFNAVADQCMAFFSGATAFMWEPDFRGKYLGGVLSPRFKITLNKAFELVALFGPTLYWKNPQRIIKPRKQLDFSPEMFGGQDDPYAQQLHQFALQQQQQRNTEDEVRAKLLNLYLDYTPDEMPDGGLAQHSELAITEALITGRGLVWPEPYKMPGSNRTLTGCFWDTYKNLLIDPDATCMADAYWIGQQVMEPVWKAEDRFELPRGTLKATVESANAMGESEGDQLAHLRRNQGKTNDMIVYTKIWSKMGAGTRLSGVETPLRDAIDRVVGDHAYIVVSPNVPFPLNAPAAKVRRSSDDSVRRMFSWPVPYYLDKKWPCAELDFYRKPGSVWPVAPLEPGLGELTYLNIFMSHIAGRIWSSSRDFIAVLESAAEKVEPVLKRGGDLAILRLPQIHKDINNVVSFLQQPQLNTDAWKIIDALIGLFERRVGLNELLYGMNPGGVQSRSAADIEAKQQNATIRPDYMANKVEQWQTEAADMEKFCARWFVEAEDVQELVGPVGAQLWTKYVTDVPPEMVVREMRATVEAQSVRKPNKQRDAQNIANVLGVLFPELSKHADATGDTNPINALIRHWGEAIDQDTEDMEMGPRTPAPPPPEVQEAQQAEMEAEQAKAEAEIQKKQLEAEAKAIDLAAKQMDLQGGEDELAKKRLELIFGAEQHEQKLEQDDEVHEQEIDQSEDMHQQKLDQMAEAHREKMRQARQQRALQRQAAAQGNGSAK